MAYRVIQWATGTVGRHAIRAVAAHPDLELVGALVYDPAKEGRDAGEIAGIAPLGVAATRDREALLALDADCVLHMSQMVLDPGPVIDEVSSASTLSARERSLDGDRAPEACPRPLGSAEVTQDSRRSTEPAEQSGFEESRTRSPHPTHCCVLTNVND